MKYFLILILYGGTTKTPAITVVPVPYANYQTCIDTGKKWKNDNFNRTYECVEHPMHLE